MGTTLREKPLWQKLLLPIMAVALVAGFAPTLFAEQAVADEGQLGAAALSEQSADLSTAAKATTKNIKVTTDGYMFAAEKTSTLVTKGKKATLRLAYDSQSFDYAYVGSAAKAAKAAKSKRIKFNTKGDPWYFSIPVTGKTSGKPFTVAFHSESHDKWYNRYFILDAEAGTLYVCHEDPVAAAKHVDELIAAIQVQERTSETDQQCKTAKRAWNKLAKPVRKLMEEYDYFGLNTGSAKKDNPLNADKIKKNEILVVSFGTSFNNSRVATIGGVEKAIQKAFPKWSVRRAFTAQIIINHIQARDGEKIDNMQQALKRAVANKVQNLVIAPTHLMHGAEYDEMKAMVNKYKKNFKSVKFAEPLLGKKVNDTTTINADKRAVAKAAVAAAAKDAGYKNQAAMDKAGVALVFMGHGTSHEANKTYNQMQQQMNKLGYSNVFIGTVEGKPADTACKAVINKVKKAGYKKVILRPLMVVAGDHANNDMADPDDPESWVSQFSKAFKAKNVDCQIKGLGQIKAVQNVYVKHVKAAIK